MTYLKQFLLYLIMSILLFPAINMAEQYNKKYIPLKAPNPYAYRNPEELWNVDNYEEATSPWIVLSERENNTLYVDENFKRISTKKAKFLEKFFVLEKNKNRIKIANPTKLMDDIVPNSIVWAKIENFIILNQPIKTENMIDRKAVIINDIKYFNKDKKQKELTSVNTYNSPYINNKNKKTDMINTLNYLNIAYVYSYYPNKHKPTSILLGKYSRFFEFEEEGDFSPKDTILGWVDNNNILTWNTREAVVPNHLRCNPIYFFKNKEDCESYYITHTEIFPFPTCNNIPNCKSDSKRKDRKPLVICIDRCDGSNALDDTQWPNDRFPYAMLKEGDATKNTASLLGIPNATADIQRVSQIIEKEIAETNDKDIVFLFDGTKSMARHIKKAGKIAQKIIDEMKIIEKKKNKGTLLFGAAIYRDYPEKEKCFEPVSYLQKDSTRIHKILKSIEESTYTKETDPYDPSYFPEAMFQGIVNCIHAMDWRIKSNKMIFLIGDTGDHLQAKKFDQELFNEQKIANLLVKKDISFKAIHLVSNEQRKKLSGEHVKAYDKAQKLFKTQNKKIISAIAKEKLSEIKRLEQNGAISKQNINFLKSYFASLSKVTKEQNEKQYSEFGEGRWSLHYVQTDKQYEELIEDQVHGLVKQVYDCQDLRKSFRNRVEPKLDTFKTTDIKSFKPQLMSGMVLNLIKRIGEEIYANRNDSSFKEQMEQIMSSDPNFKKTVEKSKSEEEKIYLFGTKWLKEYVKNEELSFFTRAYVMFDDINKFSKIVLFTKAELGEIIEMLDIFVNKYKGKIVRDNIKPLWKKLLIKILGEGGDEEKLEEKLAEISFEKAYEQQYGIALRSKHSLLKIPYAKIENGLRELQPHEIINLQKNLRSTLKNLKNYINNNLEYKEYGETYYFIKVQDLL